MLDGNGRLLVVEKEKMDAIREVLGGFEAPSCIGACMRVGGYGWVSVGVSVKERDFAPLLKSENRKFLFFISLVFSRNFLFLPRWHESSRLKTDIFLGASVLTARRSLVSAQTASSGVAAAVVSRLYRFTALLLY